MRVIQAVKMGHRSLVEHKRRSVSTIIIMGILFGVLLGLLFVVQGLENVIISAANQATGGKYYLSFSTNLAACEIDLDPDQPQNYTFACPEQDWMQGITAEVAKYHGRVITDSAVIPLADISQFIQYDLAKVPSGSLPVLLNLNTALSKFHLTIQGNRRTYRTWQAIVTQVVPNLLGRTYYDESVGRHLTVVGILPSGELAELAINPRADTPSLNPLDVIIGVIKNSSHTNLGQIIISDNLDLPTLIPDAGQTGQNYHALVVEFDDFNDINSYLHSKGCMTPQREFCRDSGSYIATDSSEQQIYTFAQLFTSQVSVTAYFSLVKWLLSLAEIVIVAIALLVMILTCIKIVSAETLNIRLYRSIGASTADVCLIYLSYLLEICLAATIFALLLGLIIGLLASAMNATSLSFMLTAAYTRVYDYSTPLISWNLNIFQICAVMLLAAPVCLLLCLPKLSKTKY